MGVLFARKNSFRLSVRQTINDFTIGSCIRDSGAELVRMPRIFAGSFKQERVAAREQQHRMVMSSQQVLQTETG